jgi:hypothetical protein
MGHTKAAALVCLLIAALTAAAQAPTIPQLVAANPGKPLKFTTIGDLAVIPIPELAAKSDVILVGRLEKRNSFLSETGYDIYTAYDVIPQRVIVDRVSMRARGRSGSLPTLTLTLYGGEIVINGTTVTYLDGDRAEWTEGSSLLLFLAPSRDRPSEFRLVNGAASAFEVDTGGRLKSLKKRGQKDPAVEGIELERILQEIVIR